MKTRHLFVALLALLLVALPACITSDVEQMGTSNYTSDNNEFSGSVAIGDGTPSVTQDGEDLYVNDQFEVDGEAQFDGTIDANSTVDFAGAITCSYAGNCLTSATTADIEWLGFSSFGDGSPNAVTDGLAEAVYIEGALEVDGITYFDGAIDADSTSDFAGAAVFSAGTGTALDVSSGGELNVDGTLDVNGTSNFGAAITCSYAGDCLTSGTTADLQWLGFASFGDATPDGVTDGTAEAVFIEGGLEVNGVIYADGAIDADSTSNFADTATFSKGSLIALDVSSGGELNNDGTLDQNGTSDFGAAANCSFAGNCLTSAAGSDMQWLGFAAFGNGTPDGVSAGTDEDVYIEGALEVDKVAYFDGAIDADSTSDFAGAAVFSAGTGTALDVSTGGELNVDGTLDVNGTSDFSAALTCSYAGNCLTSGATADIEWLGFAAFGDAAPNAVVDGTAEAVFVEGALEVDGIAYFDGAIDADSTSDFAGAAVFSAGTGTALDVSSGGELNIDGTLDANGTSDFGAAVTCSYAGNCLTSAADADIEWLGFSSFGNGTPDGVTDGTAEDVYVEGGLEVDLVIYADGAIDADSTLDVAGGITAGSTLNVTGATTLASDVTLSADTTGGNALAKNEFIGLPRVTLVALGEGTNGTTETTSYMDDTPTGEWTEDDAGTNLVLSADASYYRTGAASLKIAFTDVVDGDGCTGTAGGQDSLADNESIGFWIYSDVAITSGDFNLTIDDSDGTDQSYDIGAVTANAWVWREVNIAACDANCDTMDNIKIVATSQGGTNLTAANIYIDGMYKWDSADEEALGQAIVQDGVLAVLGVVTAAGEANTQLAQVEYTDYFVHYESGADFIVWITDESATSSMAMIAY